MTSNFQELLNEFGWMTAQEFVNFLNKASRAQEFQNMLSGRLQRPTAAELLEGC